MTGFSLSLPRSDMILVLLRRELGPPNLQYPTLRSAVATPVVHGAPSGVKMVG
jgi:hypothetical protein